MAALKGSPLQQGRRKSSVQDERSWLGSGCCLTGGQLHHGRTWQSGWYTPFGFRLKTGLPVLVTLGLSDSGVKEQCLCLTGGQGEMPTGAAMSWTEPHRTGINPRSPKGLPGCPQESGPLTREPLWPPLRGSTAHPRLPLLSILHFHISHLERWQTKALNFRLPAQLI